LITNFINLSVCLSVSLSIYLSIYLPNVRFSMLAQVGRFPWIALLHKSQSSVISLLSRLSLISFSTHCSHVFLGLPLLPSTFISLQADTQSHSSLRSTCPNHLNRPLLTTFKTSSTNSNPQRNPTHPSGHCPLCPSQPNIEVIIIKFINHYHN